MIEQHGQAVLRFCNARAGGDLGEESFQETMLAALAGYQGVRDPASLESWLFSIAARKTVDSFRARERGGEAVADLEPLIGGSEDVLTDSALWEQVRGLPSKQRQAVTLRFLGDLTHGEIALVMQTSEPAARRSVFEGLKRLREGGAGSE